MAGDVQLVTVLLCLLCFDPVVSESLYTDSDPIDNLGSTNFHSTVVNSENAWFIEFYSSWCGHCIRFAPTWRNLSEDVQGWYEVITIAAVNCADKANTGLCREYGIEAYPTIKYFPPRSSRNETGKAYEGGATILKLQKAMVDYVENQTFVTAKPKLWPKFQPLQSLQDIWHDVGPDTKHTVVLFEEEGDYLGRLLIMDFINSDNLVLRRMLRKDVTKYGIKVFPAMFLLDKSGKFTSLAENLERSGFQKAIYKLFGQMKGGKNTDEDEDEDEVVKNSNIKSTWHEPSSVQMQDLESSLHYSFRQEIGMQKQLTGGDLVIIKKFVRVLAKYFPGKPHIVNFLKRLDIWLQDKTNITGVQWLRAVNSIKTDTAFLPDQIKWVNCVGSKPHYRGYPCSLWQLFHTLTVESVRCCADLKGYSAQEVLQAMKGYIGNIFGCKECGKNFLKMAVTVRKDVYVADDSIMWLWRAHNKANARLAHDASEDPEHPKIQFPSVKTCPECFTKTADGTTQFDELKVLTFLKKYYFVSKSRTDHLEYQTYLERMEKVQMEKMRENSKETSDDKLKFKKESDSSSHRDSHHDAFEKRQTSRMTTQTHAYMVEGTWGFSSMDVSLCVLLYFMCMAIVVILYYLVSTRRMGVCRKYGLV